MSRHVVTLLFNVTLHVVTLLFNVTLHVVMLLLNVTLQSNATVQCCSCNCVAVSRLYCSTEVDEEGQYQVW